jgi:hypothetical protein
MDFHLCCGHGDRGGGRVGSAGLDPNSWVLGWSLDLVLQDGHMRSESFL